VSEGPIATAVIDLTTDASRVRAQAKAEGQKAGKAYGDQFDKGSKEQLLKVGSRLSTILTVGGAAGPALLAVGSAASAAAAGATALLGALGPAAVAGVAAYAGGLLAVQQGALLVKFGLDGMDKAIGGDAKAMAALAPAARGVATELVALQPQVEGVRRSFTGALFAGVGTQINKLGKDYFPLLNTAARQTGRELNGVALQAAHLAETGPFRRDFGSITQTNAKNLGNLGHAGVFMADAARSLLVASAPLQRRFFGFAEGAAKATDSLIQSGRQSGKLGAFFDRASDAGAQLGRILGDVAVGVFNIFRIGASSSGKGLLDTVEGVARGFKDWTSSESGIARITAYFKEGAVNLTAMGKLVGSVASGLASIGTGKQLAPLIDQIRTQLVPPLIEFLHNASASGALSSLIGAVSTLTQVFADLAQSDGSLTAFAKTLESVAKAAQFVVEHVPGAGVALGGIFTVLGGYSALKIVGLGGAVRGLAGNLFSLGKAASGEEQTLSGLVGALRNTETRAGALSTVMGNLKSGLGVAGVVGGLSLVADSSNRASKGMSVLQSAAGGALTGAGLGAFIGPEGAAIGGAIGGLTGAILGLARGTKGAGDSTKSAISSYKTLQATLDGVTGAVTNYTKAQVLNDLTKGKLLGTTRALGLSDRQAVTALTTQGAARNVLTGKILSGIDAAKQEQAVLKQQAGSTQAQVSVAYANQVKAKQAETAAHLANLRALLKEAGGIDKAQAATQHQTAVTRTFSKAINTLPKAAVTDIKTNGLAPTRAAIVDLTAKYHLTPKNVSTLIRENGGTATKAKVDSIIRSAGVLNRARIAAHIHADTSAASHDLNNFISAAQRRVINIRVHASGGPNGIVASASAEGGTQGAGRLGTVGERGRELVKLPAGSRVYGSSVSDRMIANGANSGATINVYPPTDDPEATAQAVLTRLVLAGQ
jgi:hypothetical protein